MVSQASLEQEVIVKILVDSMLIVSSITVGIVSKDTVIVGGDDKFVVELTNEAVSEVAVEYLDELVLEVVEATKVFSVIFGVSVDVFSEEEEVVDSDSGTLVVV